MLKTLLKKSETLFLLNKMVKTKYNCDKCKDVIKVQKHVNTLKKLISFLKICQFYLYMNANKYIII